MTSLSDTVIVSLITFASGLCGAEIGALVSIITAGREEKYRLREEKKLSFSQLISAYHALLSTAALNDAYEQPSSIPDK